MAVCINESPVYQALKDKSGVPEVILKAKCEEFFDKLGRYPHLDEIPYSNSRKELTNRLKLKNNKEVANIKHILDTTKSENLQEATIKLNDEYRDKEIKITPIVEEAFVDIIDRPSNTYKEIDTVYNSDSTVQGPVLISEALDKLFNLYGIKVNEVSDLELASDKWSHLMPENRLVNAFIYNGEIYLNMDHASPDSKIHEMLHLLVGSMRFSNPKFYQDLINLAESFPDYEVLARSFQDKTRNDINEEIFILELSKYLSKMPSSLSNLDSKTLYEINYNVHRTLDSILMGSYSSSTIKNNTLYNLSLREVAKLTNSKILHSSFNGIMNLENSGLHRKLNNMKSDLLKNEKLKEICE